MKPEEIEEAFKNVDSHRFGKMLLVIGDEENPRREWEPQVRALLEHQDKFAVMDAIEMLAIRWKIDEFKDECIAFTDHDDEEVRLIALDGLSTLGFRSGDCELALLFMNAVEDERRSAAERKLAVRAIYTVLESHTNLEFSNRAEALPRRGVTPEEFTDLVPWDGIHEVMERCCPH